MDSFHHFKSSHTGLFVHFPYNSWFSQTVILPTDLMSQLCSNRLSHCLHTFDMVLIVTPPSAVIFGVPSICAFPVLLVQSLAWKPPAHLDIALEWKSFPACHISHHQPQFPTHQKPCAPTRYHSCIFLNSLLIRGGQAKTKYNNWCWAVARAVRNAEVLLYGTTVKEKLLKTVSSACDYTEGICFYTIYSMTEAPKGWECEWVYCQDFLAE